MALDPVRERELAYHEKLYAGFAQQHFSKPAVRALRIHMAGRILRLAGAHPHARVLSLGCGIGDTELLIAARIGELVGIDISPAAIRQARLDAEKAGVRNARFLEGSLEDQCFQACSFDLIFAIFFLHHLPDGAVRDTIARCRELLVPGGYFYSLDPSRRRLSGAAGRLLFPRLMRRYHSPDERELGRRELESYFHAANFPCRTGFYDFLSTPLAGLLPGWRTGYRLARGLDGALIRLPLLNRLGSNLEVIARRP